MTTPTTSNQTTAVDLHAAFYYTPEDSLNNEATPLERLSLGLAYNIVANNTRKQLPAGTTVVNYAKAFNRYYATVGIATGNVVPGSTRSYWPTWINETSVVCEVLWVTKIVEVPAEYFSEQLQQLPASEVVQVVNFVLRNKC